MDYWGFNRKGLESILPRLANVMPSPLILIDGGGAGALPEPFTNLNAPEVLSPFRFEPRGIGVVSKSSSSETVLPWALSGGDHSLNLYVTESPTSSSTHPPNHGSLSRFHTKHSKVRRVSKVLQVEAKSIDEMVNLGLLPAPEFIKLDLQGGEMAALQGASNSLENCIGILVEGWHQEVHIGQGLLSEVGQLLHTHGYQLYDSICAARWRHLGPDYDWTRVDRGQFVGSETLYIKSDIRPELLGKKILVLLAFGFSTEALNLSLVLPDDLREQWGSIIKSYQTNMRRSPRLMVSQLISVLNARINGG